MCDTAVSEEVVEVTVREFDASSLVTVALARCRHSAHRALRGRRQQQHRRQSDGGEDVLEGTFSMLESVLGRLLFQDNRLHICYLVKNVINNVSL